MAERSLSLYKLAKDTGVHRNTLRALVRNNARQFDAGLLDLLCRYFDCRLEALVSFNKEEVGRVCLKRPGAGKSKKKAVMASVTSETVERLVPPYEETPAVVIAKTLSVERIKKRSAKIQAAKAKLVNSDKSKGSLKTRSTKLKTSSKEEFVSRQIDAFAVDSEMV